MNQILRLNLLGKQFHLPFELIRNYPKTLLANRSLLTNYYRTESGDYYFERNPILFPYILTYYTLQRKIYCPHHIPIELLEHECQFFMLDDVCIYHEMNKIANYEYFNEKKGGGWFDGILFIIGILFMITVNMEKWKPPDQFYIEQSWSFSYFVDLCGTLLLTSSILYRAITEREFLSKKEFLLDFFCTISSIFILANRNIAMILNNWIVYSLLMILKIIRILFVIVHCRILRQIMLTLTQRFRIVCILIFINILIILTFSQLAFAFERQSSNQSILKTHFEAFWWATTLSFTIGYGYIDPHPTLNIIGRFCGYMLTFFGLLFNGLVLQELMKGFFQIERKKII